MIYVILRRYRKTRKLKQCTKCGKTVSEFGNLIYKSARHLMPGLLRSASGS